jgi:putative nucleotidyltransferase with HDIG domain
MANLNNLRKNYYSADTVGGMMTKIKMLLTSFQMKVTIVLILALFFVACMSHLLIYQYALNSQFSQLRDKLMVIAQTSALFVDADVLARVPLKRDGVKNEAYREIAGKLNRIKQANPLLKYIYTLTKTGQDGLWQFVVDPDPLTKEAGPGKPTAYPGDRYDAARFPEMLKAYDQPAADKKLMVDEWGVTLSGYAPIRDKSGRTVAILGVDIMAEDVYRIQQQVQRRGIGVLVIGVLLSVILGLVVSRGITGPIEKIVEGTRHVAAGELDYRVDVKGHDEIAELATSFNSMEASIVAARNQLHDYFYRVMQSLVRIMEEKDTYTRGHSERVSEYSARIALKMGFSREKGEVLRKAAQLHDIGKLGIHDSILNKKEKLTVAEWKVIQDHPFIGEDILKPLSLDEEMMAVVRSHHERYDGTGYPDKLDGEDVHIFAQIVSVADAYDAMTSERAYRPAMNSAAAIIELKENSGSQFNAMIVEAFLEILAEG